MANSVRLGIAVLAAVFSGLGTAATQIDEIRNIDGKNVECFHSGLISDLNDCGFKSDWYDYVFVGSISAIVPADKDEKNIQITPEEVFHGEPPTPLTVLTSQELCLPKLAVGDRWLFFLQQVPGRPILLDYYDNASLPVPNAQQQIETLRRLKTIGEFGLVRGKVERGDLPDSKAISGARVVASRKSDHAQFFSTTDEDGVFEFEPLSPNKYDLAVDPVGTFHPDDDSVEVTHGSCWEVTMRRSPHGRISGHIRRSDGSPVFGAGVFIMDADGYNAETSDEEGSFHSDGMRPGKYVVGIYLPTVPGAKYVGCEGKDCAEPIIYLYYPGMLNRADSLVITLADDEKRDDIDFVIPIQ
jgi:hypothetical protein